MSQLQRKPMTAAEFFAWEATQESKWEFDGFQPIATNSVTVAHSVIQGNLTMMLNIRLRGKQCRPYGSDLKIEIGPKYCYPDAFVYCIRAAPGATIAAEPVVIFEIPSESTAKTGRTTKLMEYRSLPSVQRYILLEQDQAVATVITRIETGWSIEMLASKGTLSMPEVDIELVMAELYDGLDFTESAAEF